MSQTVGVVYILTNPSFPDYVKIGYADDIEQRLRQLNRSECIPFAFQVYAIYEVGHRLADLNLHDIIDRLNPNLRAIENFNGKKRTREFYAMSPEAAYAILEAIAMMHGRIDKLKRFDIEDNAGVAQPAISQGRERMTGNKAVSIGMLNKLRSGSVQQASSSTGRASGVVNNAEQSTASFDDSRRARNFTFSMCNIPIGATLVYCHVGDVHSGAICHVIDDKHVEYEGLAWTLSGLAQMFLNSPRTVQGPRYFKYNGEWLMDLRRRVGR